MKNKLVKKNMTKFDYKVRKLGIIGFVLMIISLTIALPVANSLSSSNRQLTQEITIIEMEQHENANQHLEQK